MAMHSRSFSAIQGLRERKTLNCAKQEAVYEARAGPRAGYLSLAQRQHDKIRYSGQWGRRTGGVTPLSTYPLHFSQPLPWIPRELPENRLYDSDCEVGDNP